MQFIKYLAYRILWIKDSTESYIGFHLKKLDLIHRIGRRAISLQHAQYDD